ncbi:cysteine desulfurase mitochondrial precursor [Tuber brumale]|nr:cysteine desulfurase mitochondrial precursor [Tuber brumale]
MMTAVKVVQYVTNFSCASLSPALMLQRGLTARLHRRFVSLSGKDGEAVAKVDLGKRQIYASNFMNNSGLNPAEVGNSLAAGVLKQTTILEVGSQPICLDIQATTPTVPQVLDTILSVYSGLYGYPRSCKHTYGRETTKAIHVARQQAAKLIGVHPKETPLTPDATESNTSLIKCVVMINMSNKHIITSQTKHMSVLDSCIQLQDEGYDHKYLPIENNGTINREHLAKVICPDTALVSIRMANNEIGVIQPMEEIEKLGGKNGVFSCTHGTQSVGNTSTDVGKWNDDLTSVSGPKVYGPKDIGARNTHHRPKVRIAPLISDSDQERGLHGGTHAHPLAFTFGEPCGISQEENEYSCMHIKSFLPPELNLLLYHTGQQRHTQILSQQTTQTIRQ